MSTKGLAWRSTSGFVTDGANDTYVLAADSYPTTRNGLTSGYTAGAMNHVDRNAALDVRIAGFAFQNSTTTIAFYRVDLPDGAGPYNFQVAFGDPDNTIPNQLLKFRDGSSGGTVLWDINKVPGTTAGNRWLNADLVEKTNVTWPSDTAVKALTFSNTSLFIEIPVKTSLPDNCLTYISFVGTGATAKPEYYYRQRRAA